MQLMMCTLSEHIFLCTVERDCCSIVLIDCMFMPIQILARAAEVLYFFWPVKCWLTAFLLILQILCVLNCQKSSSKVPDSVFRFISSCSR